MKRSLINSMTLKQSDPTKTRSGPSDKIKQTAIFVLKMYASNSKCMQPKEVLVDATDRDESAMVPRLM